MDGVDRFVDRIQIEEASGEIWEDEVLVGDEGARAAARGYLERLRDDDGRSVSDIASVAILREDLEFGVEQPMFLFDRGAGTAEDYDPVWEDYDDDEPDEYLR